MDDEGRWWMASVSAILVATGVGFYFESWAAAFLTVGVLGFGLVGVSLVTDNWFYIKKFLDSRKEAS